MPKQIDRRNQSYSPRVVRIANCPKLAMKSFRLPKPSRFDTDCLQAGRPGQSERRLVDFQYYHPTAESVAVTVIGKAPTIAMEDLGGGAWVARVLLTPGRYEYHYVVDGESKPDPIAVQAVQGEGGVVNSVMHVA